MVTLFDRKLKFNVECDFLGNFQTLCEFMMTIDSF